MIATLFSRLQKLSLNCIMLLLCLLLSAPCSAKTVDLTHVLKANLPNFHIDPDAFKYEKSFSIEKNGYANGNFCSPEHYGTHVDAPSHFAKNGDSIDKLNTDDMMLPCVVLDISAEAEKNPDYVLNVDDILQFEKKGKIPEHCAVLLNTGWSKRWPDITRYRNTDNQGQMHFPGVSLDAAEFLVQKRKAVYLGIDTLSLDPGISKKYDVHHFALGIGIHLIENLNNLDKIPARGANLICAPLPIENGTGSPARIFVFLDQPFAKR